MALLVVTSLFAMSSLVNAGIVELILGEEYTTVAAVSSSSNSLSLYGPANSTTATIVFHVFFLLFCFIWVPTFSCLVFPLSCLLVYAADIHITNIFKKWFKPSDSHIFVSSESTLKLYGIFLQVHCVSIKI